MVSKLLRRIGGFVVALLLVVGIGHSDSYAQDVSPEVQRELQQRGLTVQEARQRARQLGIDLDNPEQAAQRARELGIPDSQVRTWLRLVQESESQATTGALRQDTLASDSIGVMADSVLLRAIAQQDSTRLAALEARDSVEAEAELPYFGYDIFDGIPDAFQPTSAGAVDDAYVVGPHDELRLTVWGAAEMQYTLPVDQEGRIFVPEVGQFTVAGRALEELREDLRLWLSQSYSGLVGEPPTIYMDLTLARLRPIQVYVLGEVAKPGGYVLPSNATVFNALYSVGGPLIRGSLRAIDIIRNGQPIATVDLYEYLLKGYAETEVRLQTNDRVLIRPRLTTITVQGEVRRPAIYELRSGETFEDLIAYAGGLKPEAYGRQFQIERIVPFAQRTDPSVARSVLDIGLQEALSGQRTVYLEDGDNVTIYSIQGADHLAARSRIPAVTIEGAVFKPGRYELTAEVRTVRDLIERADGLTGDAYLPKAELVRLQGDLEPEVISLNLDQVMQGAPTQDLVLRPQDSLVVYSGLELRNERTVAISGQVLNPGIYAWMENMTVSDLLFKGGGLSDSEFRKDVFLMRADLFRRSLDGSTEEIIPFDLGEALDGGGIADEQLLPEDEIRIYPAAVQRIEERHVTISGAVKAAGTYQFRDNMTLEDAILQAQGFQENAYLAEVEVTRMRLDGTPDDERAVSIRVPLLPEAANRGIDAVSFSVGDTTQARVAARDFKLQHRDRVYIRTRPDFEELAIVTVRGEVQFPGDYTLLRENESLSDVVQRAGGILPTGYAGGGRLLREGEQVIVEMEKALRGNQRANVILSPGDEIVIPSTPNTVAIRGNVANEGLIKFQPDRRVSYYLERAGGALDETEAVYLTQPSGATFRVKTGWFRSTPNVGDGATIYVTRKPAEAREPFDLGETITNTMTIVSSALTIIVLATRLRN